MLGTQFTRAHVGVRVSGVACLRVRLLARKASPACGAAPRHLYPISYQVRTKRCTRATTLAKSAVFWLKFDLISNHPYVQNVLLITFHLCRDPSSADGAGQY